PLLFVHGAFSGAWMWADHFLPWFAAAGYRSYALSLRGHGGSEGRERIDWLSIPDYVADLRLAAEWIGDAPVPIGHSMGGFVVQKYLEEYNAPAAALLCAVPPQGLAASQFHMLFQKPGLFLELNRIMNGHDVGLDTIREALFAQPTSTALLEDFRKRMQIESQRAIWDMTMFHLPTLPFGQHPPLFIAGTERDVMVPSFMVLATAHTYGEEARIFPDMGHALTHERDWEIAAAALQGWLEATLETKIRASARTNTRKINVATAEDSRAHVNPLA
ncbi:MAG: lysophospholipase, partial [Zoogloeaceae bacterium]|nr:lysophospholipase [Zoogloeaceae bacterium]